MNRVHNSSQVTDLIKKSAPAYILSRRPPSSSALSRIWPAFYIHKDGKVIGQGRHEGHHVEEYQTLLKGWDSWDEVIAEAETLGLGRAWKAATPNAFTGIWVPESWTPPELTRTTDSGKTLSITWKTGRPCVQQVSVDSWNWSACGLVATEGGDLCGRHQAAHTKKANNDAAWKEKWADQRETLARDAESRKAAEEVLTRITSVLVELGHRPETFKVTASGKLACPPEVLETLVEMADQFMNS